jgi:ABC-type transporter Mla MlaB component
MKDKDLVFKAFHATAERGTIAPLVYRPLMNAVPRLGSRAERSTLHQGERQRFPRKNFLSAERVAIMPSVSEQVVSERLYWRGALTQSMSMDLGGELLNALKECDTLTVNLEGVELLDYSCLVILCAVKRQASAKGKLLVLEGLENPPVAAVVQRYRSNGSRLCRTYCGQSCLFETEI